MQTAGLFIFLIYMIREETVVPEPRDALCSQSYSQRNMSLGQSRREKQNENKVLSASRIVLANGQHHLSVSGSLASPHPR